MVAGGNSVDAAANKVTSRLDSEYIPKMTVEGGKIRGPLEELGIERDVFPRAPKHPVTPAED